MSGYRVISLQDLDEALFSLENKRYRPAVFFFQQFAEKSAKARYLTGFYFDTRYPGDNYSDITEAQAKRAQEFAAILEDYFKAELEVLTKTTNVEMSDIGSLPML